ncbi:MAG TPA: hypothetical protein VKD22_09070, partial [Ramlibacter sp.]|nr:hypothetical protein [Ramlibacter sp.]
MRVGPVLGDRVSYWGALWYPAQLVWKVSVYATLLVFTVLATIAFAVLWLISTRGIFIILLLVGLAALPVQVDQDVWFGFAGDVAGEVTTIVQTLLDIAEQLLECIQPVINFINQFMRFVLALISILSGDNLFPWAARDMAEGERYLRKLEIEREIERIAPIFYREAEAAVGNMTDPQLRAMYLQTSYRTMIRRATARMRQERFSVDLSSFCSVIDEIFNFLIDLLTIIGTAVEDFTRLLLSFFDGDGFDATFIFIFVQYIATEILAQIPFTKCFINPDDLTGSLSPSEILQLFEDQTPKRLITCLCPWAYDNPLGIPCVISPCSVVPDNPGTAIVKCFCFLPDVTITQDEDPITAFIDCLGIDKLIEAFQTLLNYLETYVKVVIDGLQTAVNYLYGVFNQLLNEFNSLKNFADSLSDSVFRDIAPEGRARLEALRAQRQPIEMPSLAVLEALRNATGVLNNTLGYLQQLRTSREAREAFVRTLDTHIGPEKPTPEEQERMQRVASASVTRFVGLARDVAKRIRAYSGPNATMEARQTLAERAMRIPESQPLRDFAAHVNATYGVESNEPMAAILTAIGAMAHTFSWSMIAARGEATVPQIAVRLLDGGVLGGFPAVGKLARHIRSVRGETQLDRDLQDAGDQAKLRVIRYLAGQEQFERMRDELERRHGRPVMRDAPDHEEWVREIIEDTRADIAAAQARRAQKAPFTSLLWQRPVGTPKSAATADDSGDVVLRGWGFVSDTFAVEAKEQWDAYRTDVLQAWERARFSYVDPVDTGERFIVIAITIVGGAAAVGVSLFGFGIGLGLTFLGTVGVALLVPILAFAAAFFVPIFEMIVDAAVGNFLNTIQTHTRYHDFVTPYILIFLDLVAASFTQGYQLADLTAALSDVGDTLLQDLNWVAAYQIRSRMCSFPIPAPPYTCPPLPLVDANGVMIGTVLDWFTDVIFFNQDAVCASFVNCVGQGRCRASIDPGNPGEWRQRECTVDAPCVDTFGNGYGACTSWPLIPEGLYIEDVQLTIDLNPQCEAVWGYPISDIRYFEGPDFQYYFVDVGPAWRYFFTTEFLANVWADVRIATVGARTAVRWAFNLPFISWSGLGFFLVGVLFFIPGVAVVGIPIITAVSNTLQPIMRTVGTWVVDFSVQHTSSWLVGPIFEQALLWVRFPNYAAYPPFGRLVLGDLLCLG